MIDEDMAWWGRLSDDDRFRIKEILRGNPYADIPADLVKVMETAGYSFGKMCIKGEIHSGGYSGPVRYETYEWLKQHHQLD